MVWATESNADKLLDSFDGGVDADTASLGSFKEDFAKFVENYDIGEVCPFVSSSSALKTEDSDAIIESVKIMNCKIDRASWRAALLACTTIGTKVEELCCVGLELSEGHVEDLIRALSRNKIVKVLRMEFITLTQPDTVLEGEGGDGEKEEAAQLPAPTNTCLAQLLSAEVGVEYLSLCGCGLGTSFADIAATTLPKTNLQALNLARNELGDAGATALLNATLFAPQMQSLSLAANGATGGFGNSEESDSRNFLTAAVALFIGRLKTEEDDAAIAEGGKGIAEYNKAAKDANKRRKKAGLDDLLDMTEAASGRVVTVTRGEGEEAKVEELVANRAIKYVDLCNNGPVAARAVQAAVATVSNNNTLSFPEEPALKATLDLTGCSVSMSLAVSGLNVLGS